MESELVRTILKERAPEINVTMVDAASKYIDEQKYPKSGPADSAFLAFEAGALWAIGFMYEEFVQRYGVEP